MQGDSYHEGLVEPKTRGASGEEPLHVRAMSARILAVDDDETVLSVMRDMLSCIGGYEVVARPNGSEALSAFLGDPNGFDLVITDYSMSGMTGLELADRILERQPETPIIILSGSDADLEPDPRIRRVVLKPIKIDDLLVAIEEVLQADG